MSNIVERLRINHFFSDSVMAARMPDDEFTIDVMRAERKEAAARIEALEAALREIKYYLGYAKNNDQPAAVMAHNAHSAWKIASDALDKDGQ